MQNIEEIVCEAAEGTVHRLWEPLAAKQRPPNAYAGKFSTPYCIAAGFVLGNAGLDAFTDERVRRPAPASALAGKVRYEVDPDNPYPNEYTGHVRVRMKDGSVLEERQPHLRGGAHEPLSRADVEDKFRHNCAYGGWSREPGRPLPRVGEGRFRRRADRPFRRSGNKRDQRVERRVGRLGHQRWPEGAISTVFAPRDLLLRAPSPRFGGVMTSRRPTMKSAGHFTFAALSSPAA